MKKYLIFLLFGLFTVSNIQAQKKTTRILFLLDGSGSMYARLNKATRIEAAKKLLTHLVDSLRNVDKLEIALRIFGHTQPTQFHDCKDTKLEVPFGTQNNDLIMQKLKTMVPKGYTLIAHSLLQAAGDFPKDPGARNIIILITDGIEECQGDPCAVSEALQKAGVILKPFVIGLDGGVDFKTAYQCVGRYYDVQTEEGFQNVMNVVISQAMNNTTAQVNLIDAYGTASESNVGMSFYNQDKGGIEYNFIHTMNDRNVPDTLTIEPTIKYKIVVHTMPPVTKENVELQAGKHNTIPIDVPQSSLQLIVNGLAPTDRVECLIKKAGEHYTLTEQDFNTTRRYIIGSYDLEVLTLPRIYLKEIPIEALKTTKIEIPTPGKLSLVSNVDLYGAIYQWNNNKLEWVCDLDVNLRKKVIALQPTLDKPYKIIYRYKNQTKASYTFEKDFNIVSGQTTLITL
ncbi:MAG: VWA domain-containing protein [Bacteroidetes bacterium]|nr:VWA domain-containing protein [Bacteroidota bacterium]